MVTQPNHLMKDYNPQLVEPTPFRNSTFKVAGLQVHVTTPDQVNLKGFSLLFVFSFLVLYLQLFLKFKKFEKQF